MPEPFPSKSLGKPFVELDSIDSTNNYALKLAYEGLAQHGSAYFAREQHSGKGQRGRLWLSQKDQNLVLSVVIDPRPLNTTQQFQLSAMAAVSVFRFFRQYAGDDTRIKWPNDLYWQDRKAGGILIENIIGSQNNVDFSPTYGWRWAVIGIGINLNQTAFPPELKNAVSLKQITGKSFDPVKMAKELCSLMDSCYSQLARSGFSSVYESYLNCLYKKDELVRFKKGSRAFEARLKTVSPEGKLVIHHATEEEYGFGEIEWIIPNTGK